MSLRREDLSPKPYEQCEMVIECVQIGIPSERNCEIFEAAQSTVENLGDGVSLTGPLIGFTGFYTLKFIVSALTPQWPTWQPNNVWPGKEICT